jgi:hypothetical protein
LKSKKTPYFKPTVKPYFKSSKNPYFKPFKIIFYIVKKPYFNPKKPYFKPPKYHNLESLDLQRAHNPRVY